MLLLTQDQRARLIANGKTRADHVPVVKFFRPSAVRYGCFPNWIRTAIDLFGLCDLGFGLSEMGRASLAGTAAVTLPLGLSIERDLHFEGRSPLTIYADAARLIGRITEDEARLQAAAAVRATKTAELPPP